MKEIINEEKNSMEQLVPALWKYLALFLLGVVVGFMFAPIKKGINPVIGSYNSAEGNMAQIPGFEKDDEDEEDED